MQMANVTFDGGQDAIMAEFEHINCPAQLAHHISNPAFWFLLVSEPKKLTKTDKFRNLET
jgi:hypothetical protein